MMDVLGGYMQPIPSEGMFHKLWFGCIGYEYPGPANPLLIFLWKSSAFLATP